MDKQFASHPSATKLMSLHLISRHCGCCRFAAARAWLRDRAGYVEPEAILRGKIVTKSFEQTVRGFGKTAKKCVLNFQKALRFVSSIAVLSILLQS